MATYQIPVVKIRKILQHDNADSLELALIYDQPHVQCIVQKGEFVEGELAVHIPVDSVIGPKILHEMGLTGRLAGPDKNRLKAVKLRGQVSQGVLYKQIKKVDNFDTIKINGKEFIEGDNLLDILPISKYNPEIPQSMSGDVDAYLKMPKFDVEHLLKYSHLIDDGEDIIITEKIHGTLQCIYYDIEDDEFYTASKGMLGKTKFKPDNKKTLYVTLMKRYMDKLNKLKNDEFLKGKEFAIYAEAFGKGVQDLHYGCDRKDLCVFELIIVDKDAHNKTYVDKITAFNLMHKYDIPTVLYKKDVYIKDKLKSKHYLFNEDSKAMSLGKHLEEGVVIEPLLPRYNDEIGMKIQLKLINDDYRLRRKGTEYN